MIANDDSERLASPIRVLVANLSGVMSEIVRKVVQQQPDMALIEYSVDLAELAVSNVEQSDVLVIGAMHVYPPPEICRQLRQSLPSLKVLVLTPRGDAAVVYWLRVKRHHLKIVSAC